MGIRIWRRISRKSGGVKNKCLNYRFGFEHASGDYIVMGDGDNTYDFTDMPRLLEPLKRGEADLVLGSRFKGEIKKGEVEINCQAKIYTMKN